MGTMRSLQTGSVAIQWSWCRAQSSYDLVAVQAQVTNTSDESLDRVLLDFNLYDQNGGFIGTHSIAVRRLDAHGAASLEEMLPAQYGDWSRWMAWSMKLARVDVN